MKGHRTATPSTFLRNWSSDRDTRIEECKSVLEFTGALYAMGAFDPWTMPRDWGNSYCAQVELHHWWAEAINQLTRDNVMVLQPETEGEVYVPGYVDHECSGK